MKKMSFPGKESLSRSNKSHDRILSSSHASTSKESPLQRAIKENENSIIQNMLSPTPLKNSTSTDKDVLLPLLDYLFEDGQLTRIEYDFVDKAIGIESASEQAESLLRILIERKDDEALETLLKFLRSNKQDLSTSDTIRQLYTRFVLADKEETSSEKQQSSVSSSSIISRKGVGIRDVIEATKRHSLNSRENGRKYSKIEDDDDRIAHIPFSINGCCVGGNFISGTAFDFGYSHDFYYGRSPRHKKESKNNIKKSTKDNESNKDDTKDDDSEDDNNDWIGYFPTEELMLGKTNLKNDAIDFKDFYLTNACLETIRNVIQLQCKESLLPSGWEIVLKNMNGLLQSDVQSVKDLLFKFQSLLEDGLNDNNFNYDADSKSQASSSDLTETKEKQLQMKLTEKPKTNQKERNVLFPENLGNLMMIAKKPTLNGKYIEIVINWGQIIRHSFQVWKERNGSNATFYSLVGVFQHSQLYQISDCLLNNKTIIQAKEHEKDQEEKRA